MKSWCSDMDVLVFSLISMIENICLLVLHMVQFICKAMLGSIAKTDYPIHLHRLMGLC